MKTVRRTHGMSSPTIAFIVLFKYSILIEEQQNIGAFKTRLTKKIIASMV